MNVRQYIQEGLEASAESEVAAIIETKVEVESLSAV